jgi:hypothetical protein
MSWCVGVGAGVFYRGGAEPQNGMRNFELVFASVARFR